MLRYQHGGRIYNKDIILDFSVNINPLGMPTEVKQSIINNIDTFQTYPDTDCTLLRKKLSQVEEIPFDNIVCGNGADDIIFKIANVLNSKNALIISPTFSEYEKSLKCNIKYYPLMESNNFRIQSNIMDYLKGVDVFYLCNPNNPTGTLIDTSLMDLIINQCIKNRITLIVDECFLDFVSNGISFKRYFNRNLNLIIIKAFTKIYSMAGIRLGYALVNSSKLCKNIADSGQAWNVSSVAQVCGLSALDCTDYIQRTQEYITQEREYLTNNLKALGFKVYPSMTNYILIQSKLDLYNLLLKNKILIRECSNYRGLDKSYFRIAIKSHKENTILIDNIKSIMR